MSSVNHEVNETTSVEPPMSTSMIQIQHARGIWNDLSNLVASVGHSISGEAKVQNTKYST
jgi:hypothetical protein